MVHTIQEIDVTEQIAILVLWRLVSKQKTLLTMVLDLQLLS